MTIDIICLITLFLGFYIGYNRGIVKATFSILAFMIAILASFKLSPIIIQLINSSIHLDRNLSIIIGFLLTFILFFVGIRYIGSSIEKGLKTIHLNIFNKLGGALLYSIVCVIIFSFSIYFMGQLNLISDNQRKSSISYPHLKKLPKASQQVVHNLKPYFQSFWDQTIEAMDEIKERSHDDVK